MTDEAKVDVSQFVEWYELYVSATEANRKRQLRDRKFQHHKQWVDEDGNDLAQELRERNQPVVTYNHIAPKVNFVRGYETRTRVDPKAWPRTPQHKDGADAITDALRYSADVADFDGRRSVITEELLVPGAGGVVIGLDPDTRNVTLTTVRAERFFYDPYSVEADYSDANFLGVVVEWRLEDAKKHSLYGKRPEILDAAFRNQNDMGHWDPMQQKPNVWIDSKNQRLCICEIYYKEVMDDGKMVWKVCHFTESGALIDPAEITWRTDQGKPFCPLVATSAFVDEENNRYGIVRGMISPQEEINKRRSRALHESIMRTFMYEDSAIEDADEFATEVAKADGKARVMPGAIQEGKIRFIDPPEFSNSQISLYQDAKMEINAVGPSMPSIAGDKSVLSGRAILAKQSIGSMELETIFDNLRRWQKQVFRRMWWLIRAAWTEEKWLRVRDSARKEGYRFVAVNREMMRGERLLELVREHDVPVDSAVFQVGLEPFVAHQLFVGAQQVAQGQLQQFMQQAQQMGQQLPPQMAQQQLPQLLLSTILQAPVMQEPMRFNDLEQLEVDIILDSAPDTAIAAHEEFQELTQMIQQGVFNIQNPPLLKAIIESSNLRNKEGIIAAIERKPDPAQVQMQQQQFQMAMQQQQMQIQLMQAQMQKLMAEIQAAQAGAALDAAKAQTVPIEAQASAAYDAARAQAVPMQAQAAALHDIARAQIGVPAEAQRDKVAALKGAAEAQAVPSRVKRDLVAAAKDAAEIAAKTPPGTTIIGVGK